MKKAFTLLETIISVTIFIIIMIFLYKTLDATKYSNNIFAAKINNLEKSNNLHNIFLEDLAETYLNSVIEISKDIKNNSIIKLESHNTYHNHFYKNITYMISSSNKLIRIESLDKFNEKIISETFFNNSYIDLLLEDIEYFEAKNNGINYIFAIKQKNKDLVFYNMYQMGYLKNDTKN